MPSECTNPKCNETLTGKQTKYCSRRCLQAVLHVRPSPEYEKAMRERRTARNIAAAGNCIICGKTTARKGFYAETKDNRFCVSHCRGFYSFIRQNGYENMDPDDVFTAYLIRLTFATTTRQNWMVMMKEAFHARSI